MNMEMEKAVETQAIFNERFDHADMHKRFDVEYEEMEESKEAQKLAAIAMSAASGTRCTYRRISTTFDEAEVALVEGLGRTHQLATATATSSDRTDDEQDSLQKFLGLLTNIFSEEDREGFVLVTAESARKRWM